jgi:ribosomal protein S18 acetylase RimI-like enzyme
MGGGPGVSRACVRIRPAEHADVKDLTTLIESVDTTSGVFSGRPMLDHDSTHLQLRLEEILDEAARTLLVAVDDPSGDVVGLLVAKLDEIGAIDLTPVLHVTHLLVAPNQRRRGVGRLLLAGAVHLAEERGVDRVLATAASGSREANRYLARLGFAPLVVHRVASTAALRRSLGLTDSSGRMAVLRRARLVRAHRNGITARVIGRGA